MIQLEKLSFEIEQHINRQVHYAGNNERGGLWTLGPSESLNLSTATAHADYLRLTVSGALNGYLEAVFHSVDGKEQVLQINNLDIKPTRIIEIPLPPSFDTGSFTIRTTASAGKSAYFSSRPGHRRN